MPVILDALSVAQVEQSKWVLVCIRTISVFSLIITMHSDHKPEDAQERIRIEKAGYKVTMDGRVSGLLMETQEKWIFSNYF